MTQTPVLRTSPSSSAALSPSFFCAWSPGGRCAAWIHLAGELDISGAPRLEEVLGEAQASAVLVLVDLRDLEFIDCAGLGILVKADAHARRSMKSLVLLRGSGQVDRILELTGLLHELEVVDLGVRAFAAEPDQRSIGARIAA